ncbi:MAG: PAS domain-containing protein [Alphaproteobacteria bacterium]|nr:PAS domain-containing protein [Alphaproteobacteria bacterium]
MTGPADDDARVRALAAELAATRREGVKALLREAGLAQPAFVWDPPAETLPSEHLVHLRGHWDTLRGSADVPAADAIRPEDLGRAIGFAILADIERDGLDFRYRLFGEKVAAAGGVDWTGHTGSEMAARTGLPVGTFYRAANLAALERRRPLFTLHTAQARERTVSWARLALPLADTAGGKIVRMLVGAVPMDQAPMTFADIFAMNARLGIDRTASPAPIPPRPNPRVP